MYLYKVVAGKEEISVNHKDKNILLGEAKQNELSFVYDLGLGLVTRTEKADTDAKKSSKQTNKET